MLCMCSANERRSYTVNLLSLNGHMDRMLPGEDVYGKIGNSVIYLQLLDSHKRAIVDDSILYLISKTAMIW